MVCDALFSKLKNATGGIKKAAIKQTTEYAKHQGDIYNILIKI